MKLIMVRHGQTVANKADITQGWFNSPLNATGRQQALETAKQLKNLKFDRVFASDLDRAVETAKTILKFHSGKKFILKKQIRERNLGIYEGKKMSDFGFSRFNPPVRPKGGETFGEMKKRIMPFIKGLAKKHSDKTVLMISHAGVICVLLAVANKASILQTKRTTRFPNGGVWEFEVNKRGGIRMT